MKLGLLTAALPEVPLPQLATWAAESGFGMLEVACWPTGKAERRYAGVTHIDVESLDKPKGKEIQKLMADTGLQISSLAYYPNYLVPDLEQRAFYIDHLKKVIDAAVLLQVPIVGTFVGADQSKYSTENLETFAKVWPPIVKYAGERGIKIAKIGRAHV